MIPFRTQAAALGLALVMPGLPACAPHRPPQPAPAAATRLTADLDAIFDAPALAHATMAVRIESLRDGRLLYARQPATLVIPASNMKIVTAAVAAARLGWDYRFTTRLEAAGAIHDGVLEGDLIVTGGGDPSIAAQDLRTAPLFDEWAAALASAGIRRVDGRLIGDDDAFDDETLGAGWAWDYLAAGYAAPSSALSYNENVAVVRIEPGPAPGSPATLTLGPPGHELEVVNEVTTTTPDEPASIAFRRLPGDARLVVRGSVPAGSAALIRTTSVDNPTRFFVEALRLALVAHGIAVSGGARDVDELAQRPSPSGRRPIAVHESAPLSSLVGYAMKVSQNFYGDMLLKAIGREASGTGSATAGAEAVRETLVEWGLPADSLVMVDGSGLSRYNYATADLLAGVLTHVWHDERLRGPFVASLPVGGHDGTLAARMREAPLDRHVQAKTGTISNVRSLSGYAETADGEKIVFSMIANDFTAPNSEIDAIMERALARVGR